jgi:hypothetical protein
VEVEVVVGVQVVVVWNIENEIVRKQESM